MGYNDKRKANNALLSQLKAEYSQREAVFKDLGDYIAPWSHDFNVGSGAEAQRPDAQIVNETPCEALEVAVSGVFNGVCDPTEAWMAIETSDPELNKVHACRTWLDKVSKIVLDDILPKSNFYKQAPEDFRSLLGFGTSASLTKEDYGESCVRFYSCTMGSYYIGTDHRGVVSLFAREMRKTALQMVQEWGEENVSRKVLDAYKGDRGQSYFDVAHIIQPNPKGREGALLAKDMPFSECYYEPGCEEDKVLKESGYESFPVQSPRWIKIGHRPWGVGPGHFALAASRTLQAREIDLALAGEKQINPPLVVPSGANLAAISLLPGSLNQSSDPAGAQGLRPLHETKFDLAAGYEGVDRVEERIRNAFWNHIFLMITSDRGGKMTAREVMERAKEKRLALTPITGITDDYLTPRIASVLTIAGKRGKLPPYPPEMKGQTLKIVYKSVLAKAAMLERAAASADHMLGVVMPLAQLRPDVWDVYNLDNFCRESSADSGMPVSQLNDPKVVEEIRARRAEQAAQAEQAEKAAMAAQTAKTLSETQTDGKTALTDVGAALAEA